MSRRIRITILATLFLIAYMLILWLLTCYPPIDHTLPPRPQFTPAEKKLIRARLVHHGLQHEISIIYGWPDNPYFIRDGKRCSFWAKTARQQRWRASKDSLNGGGT